jgi:PST family polysaccharide transporter
VACGRPDIELKWNAVYFLPLVGFVYAGTRYGLNGVSFAFTVLYLITFPIIQGITNRQIGLSTMAFLRALFPASFAMVLMALLTKGLQNLIMASFSDLVRLITGVCFGGLIYLLIIYLFYPHLLKGFIGLLRKSGLVKEKTK